MLLMHMALKMKYISKIKYSEINLCKFGHLVAYYLNPVAFLPEWLLEPLLMYDIYGCMKHRIHFRRKVWDGGLAQKLQIFWWNVGCGTADNKIFLHSVNCQNLTRTIFIAVAAISLSDIELYLYGYIPNMLHTYIVQIYNGTQKLIE